MCMLYTPIIAHRCHFGGKHGKSPQRPWTYFLINLAIFFCEFQNRCLGYMCVRYQGLNIPAAVELPQCLSGETDATDPVCWVGHCVVTTATMDHMTAQMVVSLKLQDSVIPLPEALLTEAAQPHHTATVEWMPKSLLTRYLLFLSDMSCVNSVPVSNRQVL